MDKKYLNSALLLFGIMALIGGVFIMAYSSVLPATTSVTVPYHSNVCIYKNGELLECNHNVLFNNGAEQIESVLGTTDNNGPFLNISLCNATAGCAAPAAAGSETFSLLESCGLESAEGTYASLGTGNWSVAQTYTSTCDDLETNVSRLTNLTGGIFAGNSFTAVTLQTNDQLTVNWTIWVSSA